MHATADASKRSAKIPYLTIRLSARRLRRGMLRRVRKTKFGKRSNWAHSGEGQGAGREVSEILRCACVYKFERTCVRSCVHADASARHRKRSSQELVCYAAQIPLKRVEKVLGQQQVRRNCVCRTAPDAHGVVAARSHMHCLELQPKVKSASGRLHRSRKNSL